MAGRAGATVRTFAHEIVRGVAALALDTGVKLALARRVLVARAAVTHAHASLGASGVRVVATDAGADLALLGMIWMFVGMTARAGLIGATFYVVRGVAIGAFTMPLGMARAEHREIFMTGAAGYRLLFAELMGLVTTDAGNVTRFEQGRRRHDGLGLRVTRHARRERLCRRGMLLLMARSAHLIRSLVGDGVSWRDVLVAVLARAGLRRRMLVRPMTVEAFAGVVNLHRRRERLAHAMAMSAVTGLVLVQLLMARAALERADGDVVAESVAQRAITLHLRLEASAGFRSRVRDAGLFVVAGSAAQR
jgi:hypothetical protein